VDILTLHISAHGPIQAWWVVTCDEFDILTVHTHVFICTVTLELAQAIDTHSVMLAWVRWTLININIASVSKENTWIKLISL
jgi:hypothetical protein